MGWRCLRICEAVLVMVVVVVLVVVVVVEELVSTFGIGSSLEGEGESIPGKVFWRQVCA